MKPYKSINPFGRADTQKRNRKNSVNHKHEQQKKERTKNIQENQDNDKSKSLLTNNNLEYKWTKFSNQKIQIG